MTTSRYGATGAPYRLVARRLEATSTPGPEVYPRAVVTCDFCGRQAPEGDTLTWTSSREDGRRCTYCDDCSRRHLRAIEGKLDAAWW